MKPEIVLRDPFGGTNDQVKMNPPVGSPDLLEPAGPVDPEVSFVTVQSINGRPVALLANYSLHYVGGMGQGVISADYYGAFAERLTQLMQAEHQDPPFVAILSNGTSGNINNIDFHAAQARSKPFERIKVVADAVASAVSRAARNVSYTQWVPLKAKQTEIELGVRLPSADELGRAKAIIAAAKGAEMISVEEIYARETVLLADYPARMPLILQAFRIGDLAIFAVPCEVFVETGLQIKNESPFKPAFTISLANGYNGYLPTPEHHKLGGYETWRARSAYLEPNAAPQIVNALLGLVK
jgi:hypothetical protein